MKKNKEGRTKFFMAGTPIKKIRVFKRTNKDFTVQRTNITTIIKCQGIKYYYGCGLGYKMDRLKLHKRVKKEILDNINKINLDNPVFGTANISSIRYYHFNDFVYNMGNGEVIENCTSFDINKAYYKCALNKGLISQSFYDECLGLDKIVRLGLIGSIATKKRIYEYSNNKLINEIEICDEKLRAVWFSIVKEVDNCIYELSCELGANFVFYWVDGIYVKGTEDDNIQTVKRIFDKYNFEFKNEAVDNMVMVINEDKTKTLRVFKSDMRDRKNKKGELKDFKPFNLPENKRAKLKKK